MVQKCICQPLRYFVYFHLSQLMVCNSRKGQIRNEILIILFIFFILESSLCVGITWIVIILCALIVNFLMINTTIFHLIEYRWHSLYRIADYSAQDHSDCVIGPLRPCLLNSDRTHETCQLGPLL